MTAGWDQSLAARVVVRILDRGGAPVGAGFLAGPDLVATCAHVVADAVGADPYGPPPAATVHLDLPLFADPDAMRGAYGEDSVEKVAESPYFGLMERRNFRNWMPIIDRYDSLR